MLSQTAVAADTRLHRDHFEHALLCPAFHTRNLVNCRPSSLPSKRLALQAAQPYCDSGILCGTPDKFSITARTSIGWEVRRPANCLPVIKLATRGGRLLNAVWQVVEKGGN